MIERPKAGLLLCGARREGSEFKFSDAPRTTRSMRAAMEDLRLAKLRIACPGNVLVDLGGGVEVCGIAVGRRLALRALDWIDNLRRALTG